jgi:hypothetical protein
MAWKAKTGRRHDVLLSIVSTLLAIAILAEKSAGDSPWVRFCVLWAARQADLIARDYVAGSTWNAAGRLWSPALPDVRYGTQPSDAFDIAASLRALAAIVTGMAAFLRRLAFLHPGEGADAWNLSGESIDRLDAFIRSLARAVSQPVELRDTS